MKKSFLIIFSFFLGVNLAIFPGLFDFGEGEAERSEELRQERERLEDIEKREEKTRREIEEWKKREREALELDKKLNEEEQRKYEEAQKNLETIQTERQEIENIIEKIESTQPEAEKPESEIKKLEPEEVQTTMDKLLGKSGRAYGYYKGELINNPEESTFQVFLDSLPDQGVKENLRTIDEVLNRIQYHEKTLNESKPGIYKKLTSEIAKKISDVLNAGERMNLQELQDTSGKLFNVKSQFTEEAFPQIVEALGEKFVEALEQQTDFIKNLKDLLTSKKGLYGFRSELVTPEERQVITSKFQDKIESELSKNLSELLDKNELSERKKAFNDFAKELRELRETAIINETTFKKLATEFVEKTAESITNRMERYKNLSNKEFLNDVFTPFIDNVESVIEESLAIEKINEILEKRLLESPQMTGLKRFENILELENLISKKLENSRFKKPAQIFFYPKIIDSVNNLRANESRKLVETNSVTSENFENKNWIKNFYEGEKKILDKAKKFFDSVTFTEKEIPKFSKEEAYKKILKGKENLTERLEKVDTFLKAMDRGQWTWEYFKDLAKKIPGFGERMPENIKALITLPLLPEDMLDYYKNRIETLEKTLKEGAIKGSKIIDSFKELVEIENQLTRTIDYEGKQYTFDDIFISAMERPEAQKAKQEILDDTLKQIINFENAFLEKVEKKEIFLSKESQKLYEELKKLKDAIILEKTPGKVSREFIKKSNEIINQFEQNEIAELNNIRKKSETLIKEIIEIPIDSLSAENVENSQKDLQNNLDMFSTYSILSKKAEINRVQNMLKAAEALTKGLESIKNVTELKYPQLKEATPFESLSSNLSMAKAEIIDYTDYKEGTDFIAFQNDISLQKDMLNKLVETLKNKKIQGTKFNDIINNLRQFESTLNYVEVFNQEQLNQLEKNNLITKDTDGNYELTDQGKLLVSTGYDYLIEDFERRTESLDVLEKDFKSKGSLRPRGFEGENIPENIKRFTKELRLNWMIPEDQIQILSKEYFKLSTENSAINELQNLVLDAAKPTTEISQKENLKKRLEDLGFTREDFTMGIEKSAEKLGLKESDVQDIYYKENKTWRADKLQKIKRAIQDAREVEYKDLESALDGENWENNLNRILQESIVAREDLKTFREEVAKKEKINLTKANDIAGTLKVIRDQNLKKYQEEYNKLFEEYERETSLPEDQQNREKIIELATRMGEIAGQPLGIFEGAIPENIDPILVSVDPVLEAEVQFVVENGRFPKTPSEVKPILDLLRSGNPIFQEITPIGWKQAIGEFFKWIGRGIKAPFAKLRFRFEGWRLKVRQAIAGKRLALAVVGGFTAGTASAVGISSIPVIGQIVGFFGGGLTGGITIGTVTGVLTYWLMGKIMPKESVIRSWNERALEKYPSLKLIPEKGQELNRLAEEVMRDFAKEKQDILKKNPEARNEAERMQIERIAREAKERLDSTWKDVSSIHELQSKNTQRRVEQLEKFRLEYIKNLEDLSGIDLGRNPTETQIQNAQILAKARLETSTWLSRKALSSKYIESYKRLTNIQKSLTESLSNQFLALEKIVETANNPTILSRARTLWQDAKNFANKWIGGNKDLTLSGEQYKEYANKGLELVKDEINIIEEYRIKLEEKIKNVTDASLAETLKYTQDSWSDILDKRVVETADAFSNFADILQNRKVPADPS